MKISYIFIVFLITVIIKMIKKQVRLIIRNIETQLINALGPNAFSTNGEKYFFTGGISTEKDPRIPKKQKKAKNLFIF
jgi:hypothetical protein